MFAPVSAKEEPGRWDNFTSGLLSAVESHIGTRADCGGKPCLPAPVRLSRSPARMRAHHDACPNVRRSGQLSQADFGPFAVLLSAVDQIERAGFRQAHVGRHRGLRCAPWRRAAAYADASSSVTVAAISHAPIGLGSTFRPCVIALGRLAGAVRGRFRRSRFTVRPGTRLAAARSRLSLAFRLAPDGTNIAAC